ncbi:hypothetical protein J6590_037934 [Homalodisca vitripennis]|nr:hypothetical protein J6590_037934 [Homalodisca vitripennis]
MVRPAQKTLACLFKTQITRCLPAAQRFALLALLEKKITRACKVQAHNAMTAYTHKTKTALTQDATTDGQSSTLHHRPLDVRVILMSLTRYYDSVTPPTLNRVSDLQMTDLEIKSASSAGHMEVDLVLLVFSAVVVVTYGRYS